MAGVPGNRGIGTRGIAASRRPSQQPLQCGIEIAGKLTVIGFARARQGSHHHQATGGQRFEPVTHEVAQPAFDTVADHRAAHRLAHDETRTCRGDSSPRRVRVRFGAEVDDEEWAPGPASSSNRGREVLAPPQPRLGRQHVMDLESGCSGRQAGATLATAGREDRAAGTGAHAQAEAVGLRATAVVRLEGALAHSGAPEMNRVMAGHRLAVTVRPRGSSQYARHRFTITPHMGEVRPLPIGGRRQQPSTTRPGHGTRRYAIRSNRQRTSINRSLPDAPEVPAVPG